MNRTLKTRLSIGSSFVAAVVLICVYDGRTGGVRLSSIVAALLGAVALLEYIRISGLSTRAIGRAAWVAGTAALLMRTGAEILGVPLSRAAFLVAFGLASATPAVTAVLARRTTPVLPEDGRALASAVLGLGIAVFPMMCLIEIGYWTPFGGGDARVGVALLLVTVLVSKLNDIGGYLVGTAIGHVPLAPGVSPKKSVEGSVAGIVLAVGASILAFKALPLLDGVLSAGRAALFGLLVSVATQFGDLLESLIKRSTGVKDSGALIPAFGGILDLVDSFILAAPTGYTLLWIWTT